MKKSFLLLIFYFTVTILNAQTPSLHPCGTIPGKSKWLKNYQKNPQLDKAFSDTILYVPISLHLLAGDNGEGKFNRFRTLDALCRLNLDFEQTNILFYLEGEIMQINNTSWFSHESVLDGAEMMFANNIQNTLNCYIVSNPAGNCGYNLPYGGIALGKNCAGFSDHTWAHEAGHALHLPHPFLGWEGGQSWDNSIPANYNSPAPTIVTYDYTYFKDTLILDTLIIDTAYVELLDGSNCQIAADGFCDTEADYLNYRWQCDNNFISTQQQIDPTGAAFKSDGTLIMSYSLSGCQSRFSTEQIAAMRSFLQTERSNWLYNQNPGAAIVGDTVQLASPAQDEMVQYNNVTLNWEPLPNATRYVIQVSIVPTFDIIQEFDITSTSINLSNLLNNKTYYWRVRAYNAHYFCPNTSIRGKFLTANMVGNVENNPTFSGISVYPNLLNSNELENVQIDIYDDENQITKLDFNLYNAVGQQLFSKSEIVNNEEFHQRLTLPKLTKGIYLLKISENERTFLKKLIVQ